MPQLSSADQLWERIHLIERVCRTPMRPLTVKRLHDCRYRKDLEMAEWIRKELTLRVAYRLHDFHILPFYVVSNPYIQQSYNTHYASLQRLLKVPPIKTNDDGRVFLETCRIEREMQEQTVDLISQEVKQVYYAAPVVRLDDFLERLFCFRIGRRLLIDHLLASELPQSATHSFIGRPPGCFDAYCRPADIIRDCILTTRNSCRGTYAVAPPVTLSGDLESSFTFIPNHLSLIVTEMIKNALRATVEYYTFRNSIIPPSERRIVVDDTDLPDVAISVHQGKYAIAIRISDKGGGISAEQMKYIYHFGYSSVKDSQDSLNAVDLDSFVRQDFAGYGFGVPLARLFARYFDGDLHIVPCLGVGTDVFITLCNVTEESSFKLDSTATLDAKTFTPAECIPGDAVAHGAAFLRSYS